MTPAAASCLEGVRILVGYKTYIDLLPADLVAARKVVATGMTRELDRARAAIDLALAGESVAVVSSGDAGVYGMAGLILECLFSRGLSESVPVEILPGVPALCAAAALLGAPLMHDFACVSLSDLLTPWEKIETRIQAALQADFVLVLYNPRSGKRSHHLARVLDMAALKHPPQTPVGLVKNAFRRGQKVQIRTLGDFDPREADMLSIVFLGNSQTRILGGHMVTPRGYLEKYGSFERDSG